MDTAIKFLTPRDLNHFKELVRVFSIVFEREEFNMPSDNHLQQILQREDFLCVVALHNDRVVGGLAAYLLQSYYAEKPVVYIYDVGVLADQQRKGIGKELVTRLINTCRDRGFEEIFVQAEGGDLHAIEFYSGTELKIEADVKHFSYPI